MRNLVYSVAMSLDGYIAGPNGEFDWIVPDPRFDFAAKYRGFDTLLLGRRTYELMLKAGQTPKSMGMKAVVVSTTLDPDDHREVRIVRGHVTQAVLDLKAQTGKDIWLFGGAELFRSMMDARLIDVVELAVQPMLLAGGLRVIPPGRQWPLRLVSCEPYPNGMVMLKYSVCDVPK